MLAKELVNVAWRVTAFVTNVCYAMCAMGAAQVQVQN